MRRAKASSFPARAEHAAAYRQLIRYAAFASYAPAVLGLGLLFFVLALGVVQLPSQMAKVRARSIRALYRCTTCSRPIQSSHGKPGRPLARTARCVPTGARSC